MTAPYFLKVERTKGGKEQKSFPLPQQQETTTVRWRNGLLIILEFNKTYLEWLSEVHVIISGLSGCVVVRPPFKQ